MSKNKNNNTSFFLYTALIFLVAIVLIIIAFFGQANLDKSVSQAISTQTPSQTPVQTESVDSSITKRAAALSEENRKLMEENKNINSQLDVYKQLAQVQMYVEQGNIEAADEIFEKIDYETLDEMQKTIYNKIKYKNE